MFKERGYNMFYVTIGFSILIIILGIYIVICKTKCNKDIEAVLVKKEKQHSYRSEIYVGIFKYEYEGKEYNTSINLGKSERIAAFYVPRIKYKIYINEKNPKKASLESRITVDDFLVMGIGVILLIALLLNYILLY